MEGSRLQRCDAEILHNPTYAGAYVYGKSEYDGFNRSPTNGKAKVHPRRTAGGSGRCVCRDVYPAYITWEQFSRTRKRCVRIGTVTEVAARPRKGRGGSCRELCTGGRCGARMSVLYYSTKETRSASYGCSTTITIATGVLRLAKVHECQGRRSDTDPVVSRFALTPAKVEIALRAYEELELDRQETQKQWALQLQARRLSKVELARRRYEAAEPENRLVAAELEATWEEALRRREQMQRGKHQASERREKSSALRSRSATCLRTVERLDCRMAHGAKTTSMEDRKALLRFLVKRVHLDGVTDAGKIRIDVEWHTGAHTLTTIDRPLVGVWATQDATRSGGRKSAYRA